MKEKYLAQNLYFREWIIQKQFSKNISKLMKSSQFITLRINKLNRKKHYKILKLSIENKLFLRRKNLMKTKMIDNYYILIYFIRIYIYIYIYIKFILIHQM